VLVYGKTNKRVAIFGLLAGILREHLYSAHLGARRDACGSARLGSVLARLGSRAAPVPYILLPRRVACPPPTTL